MGRAKLSALAVSCFLFVSIVVSGTPAAAAECPNEQVREQQGIANGPNFLPDCMAIEMVSPPKKFGQRAAAPQVSADGQRVTFKSLAALAETPNLISLLFGEIYLATRESSQWSVMTTAGPAWVKRAWSGGEDLSRSFSPDFSSWLQLVSSREQIDLGVGQVFNGTAGGLYQPLSALLAPTNSAAHGKLAIEEADLSAVSSDHSHFYFIPGEGSVGYLAGDPSPSGSGADRNVYSAQLDSLGQPSTSLLARASDGKVWGENCGVRIGGLEGSGGTANGRNQGAVSSDGSTVYFSTRPAQVAGSCNAANPLRILARTETGSGPTISPLVSEVPSEGSDYFQGASEDGTKVYFATTRQLAGSDGDISASDCSKTTAVNGCDLYLFDSARSLGDQLVQVSAGENIGSHEVGKGGRVLNGTTAISTDGSHVYFVAEGELTGANLEGVSPSTAANARNMYVYDAESDELTFIGALDALDSGQLWGGAGTFKNRAYPVPAVDPGGQDGIGGDGHVLLFQSRAILTSEDADGNRLDVYKYDPSAASLLTCVSCRPGGPDSEPYDAVQRQVAFPNRIGTDFAEYGRWATEDGSIVAFRTAESLDAADNDQLTSAYLWRSNDLVLLPGTSTSRVNVTDGPVLSHDGSVVAFRSFSPLLPQDQDTATDVYVARIDGGFLATPDQPGCTPGVDCQVSPGQAPSAPSAATAWFMGHGNVKQVRRPGKKAKKHSHRKKSHKSRKKGNSKRKGYVTKEARARIPYSAGTKGDSK